MQQNNESKDTTEGSNIPFWRVVLSVIQASFGVQNAKNRERDFTHGNFWAFVVAALLFTVVFVLAIIGIVQVVLS